ncbi:sulfotransferase 1E1-like [Lytechinus pictus]|uniref:sulfotransferase 1E1-like n=1 Tax=Lytechinus pictus TaxID=7653 RepID=UPI0030BA039D
MSALLAKSPAHVAKVCYEYENVAMIYYITKKGIEQTKRFKLRPDDVYVISYLKAGTTWLQQIAMLVRLEGDLSFFEGKHIITMVPYLETCTLEDKMGDPRKAIIQIAEFMGKTLPDDIIDRIIEASSFSFMKNNTSANPDVAFKKSLDLTKNKTFMRKGMVGDWKNYFTEDQNRRFDQLYQEKMAGSGLEFTFE